MKYKKHKNSHNLNHNDVIICIREWSKVNGVYFSKNTKYRICMVGLYQTDSNEIFMKDVDGGLIKYILNDEFKNHFVLDIKTNRKQKLDKILQINNG